MDFATRQPIPPLFISSYTIPFTAVSDLRDIAGPSGASITWVEKVAMYLPFYVPSPYPIGRMYWVNGSTITSSNADIGIYSKDGERLASAGKTALAGASALQYSTPSGGLLLSPGSYYFGYVCDNTTNRVFGSTTWTAQQLRIAGCLQQTLTEAKLPESMTPVAVANAIYPMVGITVSTTGF